MSVRKTLVMVAATFLAALPFQANAGDLVMNNRTDFDSTSVINNGACSTILGEAGIARAHTEGNVVPDKKVRFACTLNRHHCKADVYMTANCSGAKAATVFFDVDEGVKTSETVVYDKRFSINGTAFNITLEQN